MSSGTITTPDGIDIFYKDWGTGQPIVIQPWLATVGGRLGHADAVLPRQGLPGDRP